MEKKAPARALFSLRRKPLPLRSAHPWRYLSRRQAGTALQGPIDSAPTARGSGLWPLFKSAQTRGLTQFCARRAHFLPPPRGVLSSPPVSFRAKRERAAGAVQERTRQGHGSLSSCMKHEWAPGPQRARRNAAQRKYTPVGERTARPRLPEIEQKRRRTRLGESPSQSLPCVKGAFTGALSLGPAGVSGVLFMLRVGQLHPDPRRFFSGTARRHRLFL